MLNVRSFQLSIGEDSIRDLQARLACARVPDTGPAGDSWVMGCPKGVISDLLAYWRNHYDWRKAEAALNTLPQFTADVPTTTSFGDGAPMEVHFVHQRSAVVDATPLLLLHGWPGSFWEFEHVIGPLSTGPEANPGNRRCFHVVAPSLPGYVFSEAPRTFGFDVVAMGLLFDALMHGLGYNEYVVQVRPQVP